MEGSGSPAGAEGPSQGEMDARLEADRRGDPYLLYRDGQGRQQILSLPGTWDRVTVGRGMASDVCLNWDEKVSTVHAQLERMGDDWALVDDGLSRNGSFVNGERVPGRRLLTDRDELRFGDTAVSFHAPFGIRQETIIAT